eukprot:2325134-Prymnesium_polylepis.1
MSVQRLGGEQGTDEGRAHVTCSPTRPPCRSDGRAHPCTSQKIGCVHVSIPVAVASGSVIQQSGTE